MNTKKSILCIGSVAYDDLEIKNQKYINVVGGSATYFSLAASLYAKVYISAIIGEDFTKHLDLFRSRKINIDNLIIKKGKTFHWGGKYSDDFSSRETLFTDLGVFKNFNPTINIKKNFNGFLFLGNIQPQLQLKTINQAPNSSLIVTDTMNLWISTEIHLLWKVIKKTDIFLLNDEEAIQLTKQTNLNVALDILLAMGPKCIIIKRGSKGCLLKTKDMFVTIPAYQEVNTVDPTGAGDSFAGGFVGYLAFNGKDKIIDAAITGSALASFTVSGIGTKTIQDLDEKKIKKRYELILNKMEN